MKISTTIIKSSCRLLSMKALHRSKLLKLPRSSKDGVNELLCRSRRMARSSMALFRSKFLISQPASYRIAPRNRKISLMWQWIFSNNVETPIATDVSPPVSSEDPWNNQNGQILQRLIWSATSLPLSWRCVVSSQKWSELKFLCNLKKAAKAPSSA